MADDWETGDFEIKKVDDEKFGDEKIKVIEKPTPTPSAPKPAVKKEHKPASKPSPVLEDPVAEKERMDKSIKKRGKVATGKTGYGVIRGGNSG